MDTAAPALATRDVFLSHSGKDKAFVRRLAADIEAVMFNGHKFSVWLDEAEIRPGHSVPAMLNSGLETSRFVAFVLTPNYFESMSGWTDAEWHAALHLDPDNRRGRLLPLLAADCPYVPILLRHLLRLDFRASDYGAGLEQLLRVLRDEPLPRPVTVRGQLIQPTGRIDRATLVAERAVPDADPDGLEENLSCNLLPVETLPQYIYRAPIKSALRRTKKDGKEALPSKTELKEIVRTKQIEDGVEKPWMPAFRVVGDCVVSFHDLESTDSPLSEIVECSEAEPTRTRDSVGNEDDRHVITSLLNMSLSRHLYSRGLLGDDAKGNRFFFPPHDGREHVIEWKPLQKSTKRTVTKPYKRGDVIQFWLHQAAYVKIVFLASKFYVQITPTWLLTEDGYRVKGGPEVGRVVIKWTGQERNISVLYHVRFWTSILRRGPGPISIRTGDQSTVVATIPAFIRQSYGIRTDQRNLLNALDEAAPLLAIEEDSVEVEERSEDEDTHTGSMELDKDIDATGEDNSEE